MSACLIPTPHSAGSRLPGFGSGCAAPSLPPRSVPVSQLLDALLQQQASTQRQHDSIQDLRVLVEQQHEALLLKIDMSNPAPSAVSSATSECRFHCTAACMARPVALPASYMAHPAVPPASYPPDPPLLLAQAHEEQKSARSDHSNRSNRSLRPHKQKPVLDLEASPARPPSDVGVSNAEVSAIRQHTCSGAVQRIVKSIQFEVGMGLVIVLNMVAIFVELEWRGRDVAFHLGVRTDNSNWPAAERGFRSLELLFNGLYLAELMLRLWVHRCAYFAEVMNIADAAIVLVCGAQVFLLQPLSLGIGDSFAVGRIMRLFRVFRILKVIRFMRAFTELRILLRTLRVSVGSLFWSMSLLAVVIAVGAIFMFQLTLEYIEDESVPLDKRELVYGMFGTALRSSYTMFEATFTGTWTLKARPLIEDVSAYLALFWTAYVVIVNFAVMRVMAALFLKQTMEVASIDADRMAIENMKHKEQFGNMLREVFLLADSSGDGIISTSEFKAMMDNPEVVGLFEKLELVPEEITMLFNILSDEDGEADYQEFLGGAMKMKNSARCIDAIQILHEQSVLRKRMDKVGEGLDRIHLWQDCQNPDLHNCALQNVPINSLALA